MAILIGLSATSVMFVNCDNSLPQNPTEHASVLGDPNDINNFKEVPPPVICGKDGWDFLVRNYFGPSCGGSCHGQGGFAGPSFANPNPSISYFAALSVTRTKWNDTLINNQFCGPECNLKTDGQVYKGFQQWLALVQTTSSGCP